MFSHKGSCLIVQLRLEPTMPATTSSTDFSFEFYYAGGQLGCSFRSMKYEHWSSTSTVWRLKVGMCFYTVRFKKAVLGLLLSNAVVLPQSEKPNRNGGGDKTVHFQSSEDKAGEKNSWRTEMERSTLWRKMTSAEHKIYFKVVRRDPWRPSVPTGPCRAAFPHPTAFECL